MAKNITIAEGHQGRNFTGVKKIQTDLVGTSGRQYWIPEDEAGDYADLIEKSITENGVYNAADDGCDGYKTVKVGVTDSELGTKRITKNGTYEAVDDGYPGYSEVEVDVAVQPGTTGKADTAPGEMPMNYSVAWISICPYSPIEVTPIITISNYTPQP